MQRDYVKTRILLVDDHTLVRMGLRNLLASQPDIEVVGEAGDGQQGVEAAARLKPDVVLMDVAMPRMNGIQATQRIVAHDPHVKVIGLSMHNEEEIGAGMRKAGAVTYLQKDCGLEPLLRAIRETVHPTAA
jgi:DNA-binding NarL/FixJ family response regulator